MSRDKDWRSPRPYTLQPAGQMGEVQAWAGGAPGGMEERGKGGKFFLHLHKIQRVKVAMFSSISVILPDFVFGLQCLMRGLWTRKCSTTLRKNIFQNNFGLFTAALTRRIRK